MSSEAITRNDLTAILNEVLPMKPSEYRTLLWINPSPTSAFASSEISCDMSYDDYIIEYIGYTGQPDTKTSITLGNYTNYLYHITGSSSANGGSLYFFKRSVWRNTTSIGFGNVYSAADGTQWTQYTANTGCIPTKIYGIKYERVNPPQEVADYIVEQGSSGNWKYRVWNSGRKEAWLHASLGTLTLTKANYRNYLSYTYDTACPITFTDPVISANACASSGSTRFENVGWTSANKLSGYFMTDTNSTASSGTVSWNSVHLYAYIFE